MSFKNYQSNDENSNRIFQSINQFSKQNYTKLKAQCIEEKKLFVDNFFPAADSSLFKNRKLSGVEWKRPKVDFFTVYFIFYNKKTCPTKILLKK